MPLEFNTNTAISYSDLLETIELPDIDSINIENGKILATRLFHDRNVAHIRSNDENRTSREIIYNCIMKGIGIGFSGFKGVIKELKYNPDAEEPVSTKELNNIIVAARNLSMADDNYEKQDYGIQDGEGKTPLMQAVRAQERFYAKHFIEQMDPIQLAASDDKGQTALHLSLLDKQTDVSLKIIEKLPLQSLFIKSTDGKSPFTLAKDNGDKKIMDAIIFRLSTQPENSAKLTLEFFSIELSDHKDIIDRISNLMKLEKLFIEKNGDTELLLSALQERNYRKSRFFIERMQSEHIRRLDTDGNTVIMRFVDGLTKRKIGKYEMSQPNTNAYQPLNNRHFAQYGMHQQPPPQFSSPHHSFDNFTFNGAPRQSAPLANMMHQPFDIDDVLVGNTYIPQRFYAGISTLPDRHLPKPIQPPMPKNLTDENTELLQILFEKTPKDILGIQNNNGESLLTLLINLDSSVISRFLTEHIIGEIPQTFFGTQDNQGATALISALRKSETLMNYSILNSMTREQLGLVDNSGNSALMIELRKPYRKNSPHALEDHRIYASTFSTIANDIAKKMLPEHLAIQNADHDTALGISLSMEKHDVCKNLIKHMLPEHFSITDKNGNTALITAINRLSEYFSKEDLSDSYQLHSVEDLIIGIIAATPPKHLSITNKDGKTPLMAMAESEIIRYHPRLIEAILEKIPNNQTGIQNTEGKTALTFALEFFKTNRDIVSRPLHRHTELIRHASRPLPGQNSEAYARYREIAYKIMQTTNLKKIDPQLYEDVSNNIDEQSFVQYDIKSWEERDTLDYKNKRLVGRLATELYADAYYISSLQAIIRKMNPEQIILENSENHFNLSLNNIKSIELNEAKNILMGNSHTNTFYFREAAASILLDSFIQASYQ